MHFTIPIKDGSRNSIRELADIGNICEADYVHYVLETNSEE